MLRSGTYVATIATQKGYVATIASQIRYVTTIATQNRHVATLLDRRIFMHFLRPRKDILRLKIDIFLIFWDRWDFPRPQTDVLRLLRNQNNCAILLDPKKNIHFATLRSSNATKGFYTTLRDLGRGLQLMFLSTRSRNDMLQPTRTKVSMFLLCSTEEKHFNQVWPKKHISF